MIKNVSGTKLNCIWLNKEELEREEKQMGRPAGSRNKQVAEIRQTNILESVKELTLDKVSAKIAATQVEVQNQLANLSTKMTEQLTQLKNVDDAILVRKDELKNLYDIEAEAVSFDELTAQHEQRKLEMNAELQQLQNTYKDTVTAQNLQRQREEEAYQYNMTQGHKVLVDQFNAKMAQLDKDNKNKQEELTKSWADRDNNLKLREQELIDLRNQVVKFPEQLKAEVDKNVAIATSSLKRTYEMETKIAAAENASTIKLAEQQNVSLNKTISELNGQIVGLKDQLKNAHDDIKTISQKALESASGREALANLQRTVESLQSNKNSK